MPTYNEAENIEAILRAAAAELERVAPGQYRILVVDDSSPDGTGQLADAVARELEHRRGAAPRARRRASAARTSPGSPRRSPAGPSW